MNPLFNNPIGNMRGPDFLIFYGLISLFTYIGAQIWLYLKDPSRGMAVPPVPPEIDPFEVAYLRGDHDEYVRLMILDLVCRGYLVQCETGTPKERVVRTIDQAAKHPDVAYLDATERVVFDFMKGGRTVTTIIQSLVETLRAQGVTAETRRALESQHLLATRGDHLASRGILWLGALIVLGLPIYKICAAISHGRTNIFFLIILCLISTVTFFRSVRPSRLTKLGRSYLAQLQDALSQLKNRARALVSRKQNDHLLLLVSAFGFSTLTDTDFSFFPTVFQKAATNPSPDTGSSCGSNCSSGSSSSSCSSGSSCGSSCGGGCGGGGCGGCGS